MSQAACSEVLPWNEERDALGREEMDQTHREFADLVNRLAVCDGAEFARLFAILIEHTRQHFTSELGYMVESGFPARDEHVGEHTRVLGEMEHIGRRVERGVITFARAYVRERLPEWFALHLTSMDAALAVHLSRSS